MMKNTYIHYEFDLRFLMNLERAPPTADDPKLTDRLVCQVSYCILGLCKRPCTGWVGGNGLSLPGLYRYFADLVSLTAFLI